MGRRHLRSVAVILALLGLAADGLAGERDESLWAAALQRRSSFADQLRALVDIDSGTGHTAGLSRIETLLADRLRALDAEVRLLDTPPASGRTVVGSWRGTGAVDVMLMIHYDTVYEPGEATRRPFRVEGTRAYGPGVADAKGGVLVILHALEIAHERGLRDFRTLTVLFNPDEEKSSLGSRHTIRDLAAQQDFVLSFEPPEADQVIVGTNGIAWVHLEVTGRAAHAGAAPDEGRNAALELAHQLLQLRDLGDRTRGTTVNWTTAQAGRPGRINVIPDKATATADMRMADAAEIGRVDAQARHIVRKRLIPDTEVSVHVESRRPPFSRNAATDRLAMLAQDIAAETGVRIRPVVMGYGTDAGFAYGAGGSGLVILEGLGIVGAKIHTPDEWVDLESIPGRIYLAVRLLEALGQGRGR